MTICRASRRSLRMARLARWSGGHLAGCLYHAFARSAARDRMRGNPPLPFRIGLAGERLDAGNHARNDYRMASLCASGFPTR